MPGMVPADSDPIGKGASFYILFFEPGVRLVWTPRATGQGEPRRDREVNLQTEPPGGERRLETG